METFTNPIGRAANKYQSRGSSFPWLTWFLGVLVLTVALGIIMVFQGAGPSVIAWLVFFLGAAAILYQPRYGIYLIVFFGLAGDTILLYWYPFAKNFSSSESLLYVNHSIIFSPLETYLVLTFASWLVRGVLKGNLKLYFGQLGLPSLLFLAFTAFGLGYGLATGGNTNIALWEARPIFYLIAMIILTSNLLEKREHVQQILWIAMIALFIVGIAGDLHYLVDLKGNLQGIEAITEHGTAIQMNTLFVFVVGAFLYRISPGKRLALLLMFPVVALTYIATQRRAAYLTLIVVLILTVFLLYKERRRVFWLIVPAGTLIAMVYGAIFWNSSSKLALPVEAVKSVFYQNAASARDQSSNNYRILENENIRFTIHTHPLTGVGFGKQFIMHVPLPDISFFVWWQYITHNSIMWVWMKTGAAGFLSLLFLIGLTIIKGMQAVLRFQDRDLRVVAFVATLYVIMHFIYAYVDMSWEARSMIYVGVMIGIINNLEMIASLPSPNPGNGRLRQFGSKRVYHQSGE